MLILFKFMRTDKICNRCGACESRYFYKGKCRRCIGLKVAEEVSVYNGVVETLNIGFELTKEQKKISSSVVRLVNEGKNVYVEAVCGAGKTEMCYDLIKKTINQGLKIGWAIPRREVVMELYLRLSSVFNQLKVVRVCEGYTDDLFGDLIICTTHQLFRYHQYFDILIIDEPDAFPFIGNEMLEFMAKKATRHNLVYLSATYDAGEEFEILELSTRPSGESVPLPKVVNFFQVIKFLNLWKKESVLIFVPTIKIARKVSFFLGCDFISSKSDNKEVIINKFRKDKGFLVCTTILERGVTFKDCYVIVLFAGHRVFSKASLIQIAGRVRRGMNPTKGEVLFWGNGSEVRKCIEYTHYHRNSV